MKLDTIPANPIFQHSIVPVFQIILLMRLSHSDRLAWLQKNIGLQSTINQMMMEAKWQSFLNIRGKRILVNRVSRSLRGWRSSPRKKPAKRPKSQDGRWSLKPRSGRGGEGNRVPLSLLTHLMKRKRLQRKYWGWKSRGLKSRRSWQKKSSTSPRSSMPA